MVELFANSGDPDQMPCSAPSDVGLHCLQITRSSDYSGLDKISFSVQKYHIFLISE